jgi:hypothetical protein
MTKLLELDRVRGKERVESLLIVVDSGLRDILLLRRVRFCCSISLSIRETASKLEQIKLIDEGFCSNNFESSLNGFSFTFLDESLPDSSGGIIGKHFSRKCDCVVHIELLLNRLWLKFFATLN